jgi:hypothetical protein
MREPTKQSSREEKQRVTPSFSALDTLSALFAVMVEHETKAWPHHTRSINDTLPTGTTAIQIQAKDAAGN